MDRLRANSARSSDALAGAMQLLDAGIGLFQRDLRKCAGPLFLAVLQFFVVYLLHISVRITP
jgi:hypothetical protein